MEIYELTSAKHFRLLIHSQGFSIIKCYPKDVRHYNSLIDSFDSIFDKLLNLDKNNTKALDDFIIKTEYTLKKIISKGVQILCASKPLTQTINAGKTEIIKLVPGSKHFYILLAPDPCYVLQNKERKADIIHKLSFRCRECIESITNIPEQRDALTFYTTKKILYERKGEIFICPQCYVAINFENNS